jgi:hypothetical protein
LVIAGVETRKLRSKDKVAVIARQGRGFETFSLVNLMGIDSGQWDTALTTGPDPLADLPIQIHTAHPVARAWYASPDGDSPDALPVAFTQGTDAAGTRIAFTLPRWTAGP